MEKNSSCINNGDSKVKLLCSYGGKIQPRPSDHHLSYVGGDTKILAVDPTVSFSEMAARLIALCNRNDVSIKYQLPGEDLDALVSLINDEDVEHMMAEYDRMKRVSTKPTRIRLFIFDKSGNGKNPAPARLLVKEDLPSNPDYLFGFDKDYSPSIGPPLDLLQIPGMFPFDGSAENRERIGVNDVNLNASATAGTEMAAYRLAASGRGAHQSGLCNHGVAPLPVAMPMPMPAPCMLNGISEQSVYAVVPIIPSIQEQIMTVAAGNNRFHGVNQGKI